MKALSLVALLAVIVPPERLGGSSVDKVATNISIAETSPFIEDSEEVSITMRSGSDEPDDNDDERMIKWPGPVEEAVPKLARLANERLSLEANEMKAFREVQANKNAFETLESPNTRKTLIAAPTNTGEDDVVEIALTRSKKSGDAETKTISMTLPERQLDGWLKDGITPGDFLTSLKLHEGHVGSKLEAFDQFLTAYNKKDLGHIYILDFLTLKLGGEGELASLLVKGANSDATENAKVLELEEMLLTKWKDEKLSALDIVDRLKLTETVYDLISPKLATFMKYIASASGDAKDPADEIMLLGMSTKYFGDEAVAVALVRARDDAFLKPHVEKLEKQLLEIWLADGKLPEDVFSLMNVDATRTDAYFDQQVVVLDDFIELYNKKENAHVMLLAVMTSGCGGEDNLASMLGTLRKNPLASAKVVELESLLQKKWKVENMTPENVVHRLKMDKSVEDLTSRKLGTLLKYSATYKEENVGCEFSLPDTFTRLFGNDAVVEALVQDESFYDSTADAKIFEKELLKSWLAAGKTPDFVSYTLNLRDAKSLAHFDQRVEMLLSFIKLYNEKTSTHVELFPAVVSGCGGEHELAHILGQATIFDGPDKQALELERLLLSKWKMEELTLENLFIRLSIHFGLDHLTGPRLVMMMKYIASFNEDNMSREIALLEKLTSEFRSKDVMRVLVTESNIASSREHMKTLQILLLKKWLAAGKTDDDVFKLLELGTLKMIEYFDQQVEVMEDFIKFYNEENSIDVDLLATMTYGCGGEDELAFFLGWAKDQYRNKKAWALEKLLLSKWRNEELAPEDAMHRLKMAQSVDEMISPKLETFVQFIDMLNKEDPIRELSVLKMFTTRFGDAAVAEVVASAREGYMPDAYKKVVEPQQLKRWLEDGKTFKDVFDIIKPGKGITPRTLFNGRVPVLEKFIELHNKENSPHVDLLTAMASGFGGEKELASMAMEASIYPHKSDNALKFVEMLITRWRSENLSPGDVLVRIGAAETVEQLTSPVLPIVKHYADMFDKAYPMRKFSLLETFITRFGVEVVVGELARARTADPSNKHVKELEKELMRSWHSVNKSMKEVFALLNMKSHVDKVPRGLKFEILIKYMESKHRWSRPSIFEALKKCYDDDIDFAVTLVDAYQNPSTEEIAEDYLMSLFKQWCRDMIKPDREFIKRVKERDAINWATLVDMYAEYFDEEAVDVIHMTTPRRV